jgi:hypothetical protein
MISDIGLQTQLEGCHAFFAEFVSPLCSFTSAQANHRSLGAAAARPRVYRSVVHRVVSPPTPDDLHIMLDAFQKCCEVFTRIPYSSDLLDKVR